MPFKLDRPQILTILAGTALCLQMIAAVWSWLAGVPLTVWHWDPMALGLGVILGTLIHGLSIGIYSFWPPLRQAVDEYLALVMGPLKKQDALWLGVLPGISEELLFRGVALTTLGPVLSSLIFGLLHFSGRDSWPYTVWATLWGFVMAMVMMYTGNLLIPVTAHIINNWLAAWFWFRSQPP